MIREDIQPVNEEDFRLGRNFKRVESNLLEVVATCVEGFVSRLKIKL